MVHRILRLDTPCTKDSFSLGAYCRPEQNATNMLKRHLLDLLWIYCTTRKTALDQGRRPTGIYRPMSGCLAAQLNENMCNTGNRNREEMLSQHCVAH